MPLVPIKIFSLDFTGLEHVLGQGLEHRFAVQGGIATLSGVGRKSLNPSFLQAVVAALSQTPNASVRRLLNLLRFTR